MYTISYVMDCTCKIIYYIFFQRLLLQQKTSVIKYIFFFIWHYIAERITILWIFCCLICSHIYWIIQTQWVYVCLLNSFLILYTFCRVLLGYFIYFLFVNAYYFIVVCLFVWIRIDHLFYIISIACVRTAIKLEMCFYFCIIICKIILFFVLSLNNSYTVYHYLK